MLGSMEWIIIGFVVVLLFGINKLPRLGKAVGESIKNLKEGLDSKEGFSIKDVETRDKSRYDNDKEAR